MQRFGDLEDARIRALMTRYGGCVAHVLNDPTCLRFEAPGIEGLIAYRQSPRCRVVIGDPICAPADADALARAFREDCRRDGHRLVFAAAGESFMERCLAEGYGAVEFGQEIVLDPRQDRMSGPRGRELRKKVKRADREGVTVREQDAADAALTAARMRDVGAAWLAARRGPSTFITPLHSFERREGRRCLYATKGEDMVGVLSLVRMDAKDGWVLEHLVPRPDAPIGTAELLVVRACEILGAEGAAHATFGPAALPELGRTHRVTALVDRVLRSIFWMTERFFHLGTLIRFREKFRVAKREPSYILFSDAKVGPFETAGLIKAFSVH